MLNRTKILLADADLTSLSKIYLALLHRGFKVEATDKVNELGERLKRFKPEVLILSEEFFAAHRKELRQPVILLASDMKDMGDDGVITILKPVSLEQLYEAIQRLVI